MNELKIDSAIVKDRLVKFIRKQVKDAGLKRVVVGLSGGLDSSLTLYLCAQALGENNVFALILPYKTTRPESVNDAKLVAQKYQVKASVIDITPQIDAYFNSFPQADKIRRGNKMARERMSVLFDHSKELGALVAGTGNKTEVLLGYGTLYGDTACAFNPLGGLYKTQARQLARDVGIPEEIIKKVPSAELWPGQSDESELGLTYSEVDRLLYYLVDKNSSDKKLLRLGFSEAMIEKVKRRISENAFKRKLPSVAQA
ncbi:MAG: NAD+ synthase [Candidatus Omnitrophota bacterium]|nr:MAG: NAD+ synthase [Candidatus Omnitrophota bacterium]